MFRALSLALVLLAVIFVCLPAMVEANSASEVCALIGQSTLQRVQLRDRGIPPSEVIKIHEKMFRKNGFKADHPVVRFDRWALLFVYDMSAVDAAWIRQQVETKCFHTFKN